MRVIKIFCHQNTFYDFRKEDFKGAEKISQKVRYVFVASVCLKCCGKKCPQLMAKPVAVEAKILHVV